MTKERKLQKAIGEFIESKGWKVMVIGSMRIEQRNPRTKYNFEFVVGFTGKKRRGK